MSTEEDWDFEIIISVKDIDGELKTKINLANYKESTNYKIYDKIVTIARGMRDNPQYAVMPNETARN